MHQRHHKLASALLLALSAGGAMAQDATPAPGRPSLSLLIHFRTSVGAVRRMLHCTGRHARDGP